MSVSANIQGVALAFGVSASAVYNWRKCGCPELQFPPHDITAIEEWRKLRPAYRSEAVATPIDTKQREVLAELQEQKLRADIQLKRVKKQLDQQQLRLKRGELIETADCEMLHIRLAGEVKKQLLRLPNTWADELAAEMTIGECKRLLEEMVQEVLTVLHRGEDASAIN